MPKKKILDSARDYLARMHATRAKDVPSILRQGLRPMPHPLDGQSDPSVFMTAGRRLDNTFYGMAGRDALIKYRIPKDWHRRNVVPNSHYMDARVEKDPDWPYSYEANVENRKTVDVMNGGRSTTYRDVVPNEFIEEVCFGPNAEMCYDPRELQRHIINDAPSPLPDNWDWNYYEDFYPDYEDVYRKYGRRK